MKFSILSFLFFFNLLKTYAQETSGYYITDKKTNCKVWFKHNSTEDSVTWNGEILDSLAHGKGTMRGFTNGKLTNTYKGYMKYGKMHGKGEYYFGNNRSLIGHFSRGNPLFLSDKLLKLVKYNIVYDSDSLNLYVGDNNAQKLYYQSIIPEGEIKGAVILMPGTWESTEHLISSMSVFCEQANKEKLAIIVLSINQRLTMNNSIVSVMNKMINNAIITYHLPKNKFVIGGWSMGGLFSLRYTELANQDSSKTAIKPLAVFSCDGPCDLKNIYNNFKRKLHKNPGQNEPAYGMKELETYCGGSPEHVPSQYQYFSCYSHGIDSGGNAKYLINTPVRIYGDVDPVWWMNNRNVDMYDLNALDQTAMIQLLKDLGNTKAEFINAFQKGVRIEGNRHPHSWSIVEPYDCVKWILIQLK